MKFQSQKVAYYFFAVSMLLFSLQLVYGFIMGFAHMGYDVLHEWIPFNAARAVHTNLLVMWMLAGFMGAAYYIVPEECDRELIHPRLALVQLGAFVVVGLTALVGFHFNWWEGRKFCPDISLSYSKGSLSRFIYVEYEKTTKTKARYIERWLTYHADPKLRACLYITDDPNVEHRLEKLIETYLRNSVQRSAFTFGLFVQRANVKLSQETVIRELGRGISRAVKLNEFLTSEPSQSRCRPNFSNEIFSSDFTEMAERGRLTTLSLPSSASLEVPKGTEKVVNLPLRQVKLNNKDGREKFGRHRE